MPRMGRRYKTYQAETGVTYQYFFDVRRSVVRPEGQGAGSDFAFVLIADQRPPFVLRIFVAERALAAPGGAAGGRLGPPRPGCCRRCPVPGCFRGGDRCRVRPGPRLAEIKLVPVPPSGRARAVMVAPWAAAMARTMDSPRP